ncbi:MAG: putative RDD family membrane protein YckC [Cognaticolwellia sp.]|jgi:uncharacterized RDD family membrane protein YckC
MSNPYTPPESEAPLEVLLAAERFAPGKRSSRIFATFIDLVAVGVIWVPVLMLLDLLVDGNGPGLVALVGVALVYGTLTTSSRLQGTLGHKLNGLRVVQANGDSLSVGMALVHSGMRLFLGSLMFTWLFSLFTKRSRALWDFPAGAHVIGSRRTHSTEDTIAGVALNDEID